MNTKFSQILLAAFMLIGIGSYAQVANDDCFGAQPLGTLGTPAPCPSGLGAVMTVNNLTNVNSVTEMPYTTLINCQPSNNTPMASPATDVWYSVVVTGNELVININGNIAQPNIAVYQGNCNGLVGRGCAIGAAGSLSASFDQMVPGNTYYIQVSGGSPADQGTFNMTLQNNNSCNDCLLASNLTVNPLPLNGTYQGGTTVTFCYTITQWDQQNTNWLHAVIPTFGNGWDMTTLTNLVPANTCDAGPGVWQWFNNVNTPNGNGIMSGFFFDGDMVQGGPNGNPVDNFGDNCNGNVNWTFCWTITAKNCPPGQNGDDLGVTVDTYGDGETGNWTNVACVGDPVFQFNSQLACCAPPQIVTQNVLCNGANTGSATATAVGTGPFDYVWTNANNVVIQTSNNVAGANTINNLTAGSYTVSITDQNNGCVTNTAVVITEPTALQTLIGSTPESCNQANGTATVTPQGGVGPYDFIWTDANNVVIQTANNVNGANTASGLVAGTYNIAITDANGCSTTVSIVVQGANGNIQAASVSVDASCFGLCDGSATVTPAGGTGPYDFSWVDAANVVVATATNVNTHTANSLCAGSYTVTITDANNCTATINVIVNEPPAVTAQASAAPATICIGQSTTITATPGGGIGSGYTYNWTPAGTGTNQSETVSPTTTTVYTVVVRDGNGCQSAPASVTVTVYPPLNIALAANPTTICAGQNVTLTANGGGGNGGPYTYSWQPNANAGNVSQTVVTPTVTTTYTVTVDDGCTIPTATAVITVTVNPIPTVSFTGNPLTGCAPLDVAFVNTSSAANNPTCLWDFGDGNQSNNCNPNHVYTTAGCYDVLLTYTDDNGCTNSALQQNYICVNPNAVADFSAVPQPTSIFNPIVFFTDLSTGGPTSWSWTFQQLGSSTDQNPTYEFPDEVAGCYDVTLLVNNQYNCPDDTTKEVCIDPEFVVYFPNAITPNGDGNNETFFGTGIGIAQYEIWIFDRWGNMIFYSDDITKGWDGTVQGTNRLCQEDVYIWKAKITDVFDKKHDYIGHVSVVR